MITVVIASFNYGHLAAHCIETILSQSKQPDRIIFVDDGAGDCGHLPRLYPEVNFILRNNNLGVVNNFQDILMNHVHTDRVMFVGADNWLRSDALELTSQQNTDLVFYDVVFTGTLKRDRLESHADEVREYQGDLYWDRTNKHHGSMLYNAKLAKQVGGYSKRTQYIHQTEEDWALLDKMRHAGATQSHVAQPLLYYRRHRQNYFKY